MGLFYGSDEGNTQRIAYQIVQKLGDENVDIYDIADATQADFVDYCVLILGISTWDFGQIQSDWDEFWSDVEAMDFTGKTVALFGLGDQFGYGDFFLDAMGMLHNLVKERGAKIIGHWPIQGYEFDASKALAEDKVSFVGLALDEDQQSDLTDTRLEQWCDQILQELAELAP
jgi:flavodoxin long chain